MPENTNGDDNATTSSLLRAEDGTMDEECHREEKRPKEPWGGEYVKSIVYAGLDAIITSFSLISSISGGSLSSGTYTHIIASELFFFLQNVASYILIAILWILFYSGCFGIGVCKSGSRWYINGIWGFCVERHGNGHGCEAEDDYPMGCQ